MNLKNLMRPKRESLEKPALVPFFCDTHPNSTVGLVAPGGIPLDDGGWYRPSKVQLDIWHSGYVPFWRKMAELKRELGAVCLPVFGGDGSDRNKYSKYQLATVNEAAAVKAGIAVLEPALKVADGFVYLRGTESHTGGSGHLEELISMNIGIIEDEETGDRKFKVRAARDPETGTYSHWYKEIEFHGVLGLFSHHPFSSDWMPWTEGGGAMRTAMAIEMEYLRAGKKVPNFAAFGHNHRYSDSGETRMCRVYNSPGWTVAGAYIHRKGRGWTFNPLGGLYFVIFPNGEWYGKKMTFRPRRPEPWLLENII